MGNFSVLPIVIVLLLIGLIIFLISKGKRNEKRRSSSKKKPVFFLFYVAILTLVMIIYVLLPNNKLEVLEAYEGNYEGEGYFYEVMNQTKSIEEIAEFKQTEKSYPFTGDQLDFIESTSDDYYHQDISILLVKDPLVTGEFIVETYETPFIHDGNDISEFIKSAEVGSNDGVVTIHLPGNGTLLKMYDYSFPFKQFSGEPSALNGFSSYQLLSEQLIVIYIPEDVTPNVAHITGDSIYHVEMITKE